MPQSLASNLIHLIFSTKSRRPWLCARIRNRLFAYMAGILKEWGSPALMIGGAADHVHVLCLLSKNHALKAVVEALKKGSSKWMKLQGPQWRAFQWQAGYGAFSVSQSGVGELRRYIANQQEHHRTRSFQEEFRVFLHRHGIESEERYVWD